MAAKLNSAKNYEPIQIVIDKELYPITYNNKVEELINDGWGTREEIEKEHPYFFMECEIYYEQGGGLFIVECGAVEAGTIYSPYSGELCEDCDLD